MTATPEDIAPAPQSVPVAPPLSDAEPQGAANRPRARSPAIPRILHQAAIDTVLGPEIVGNLAAIRRLNPNWDYRLYDARGVRDFIEQHYGPRMVDRYARIGPEYGAAKADLFRYLAVYKLGGVYLDLKSFPSRPLDEVIEEGDEFLLSRWRNGAGAKFQGWGLHKELRHLSGGEFQQWFIIARPEHPFLRAVIRRVVRNIDGYIPDLAGTGRMGVLRTTGPIAYTLAIAPLLKTTPHRVTDSEADLGLNYSIYLDIDYTSKAAAHYSQACGPVAAVSPQAAAASAVLRVLKALRNGLSSVAKRRLQGRPETLPEAVVDRGAPAGARLPPPTPDSDDPGLLPA